MSGTARHSRGESEESGARYRGLAHDGVMAMPLNCMLSRRDGVDVPIEDSVATIHDREGKATGAVVVFRDVSERRAIEQLKGEFVSVVSHELRTPLTSIRGALGLLAGGLLIKSPEKGQRMLDIAVSNTDRLIRLINDILDAERIDSGTVALQRTICRPEDLLESAVDVMRPMAEKARVRLEILPSDATEVWADCDRIIQTLTNLLSNAIKFSPPESVVSIRASQEPGAVRFSVRDQGRGIPADKLEAVFERFQQVDASDARDKGGSGLGLAISRSLVRQHGGDLTLESSLGEGSHFTFTLPSLAAMPLEVTVETKDATDGRYSRLAAVMPIVIERSPSRPGADDAGRAGASMPPSGSEERSR